MRPKGVLIIGSGKRVRAAGLPAFQRMSHSFEVRRVFARRAKDLEVEGHHYVVAPMDELDATSLEGIELIYVAVTKDAVPRVLERLAALEVGSIDLLIDTPVVRFKHFRHIDKLSAFRNAWVAEDCVYLPWIELARRAIDDGRIGEVEGVLFTQSAYAYHGLATAKAVLGETRVRRARRRKIGAGFARRDIFFSGGHEAWVVEPRDYSTGRIAILGKGGSIADYEHEAEGHLQLSPVVEGSDVIALRLGDETTPFDEVEIELLRGDAPEVGLTARMDAMKRVGFLRLLRAITRGEGAYPVDAAIDDTVVDYYLEKLGRYRATPLTDSRAPLARSLLKLVTRLGG